MPIIDYLPEGVLCLKAPGLKIGIFGRNVKILEPHLVQDRLIWIKESLSGFDTKEDDIYIEKIKLEGKLFENEWEDDL